MPNAEIKCHRCLKIHESKEGAGLCIFLTGVKVGILVFIFVYVFYIQEKLNKMSREVLRARAELSLGTGLIARLPSYYFLLPTLFLQFQIF